MNRSFDDGMMDMGCDGQDALKVVDQKIKKSQAREEFFKLIEGSNDFTIKTGKKFTLNKYLSRGYNVEGDFDVRFVNDGNVGHLFNKEKQMFTVFHEGTHEAFETTGQFPQLCKYIFTYEEDSSDSDGEIVPDHESMNHIKILLKDDIFEDYVHDGFGIILNNDKIHECYKDLFNKN